MAAADLPDQRFSGQLAAVRTVALSSANDPTSTNRRG
jgi:hypothetical protein